MNSVQLVGTLTAQPELRYTPSGLAIAKASLAGQQPRIWYQRVTIFGRFAEIVAELPQGDVLGILGGVSYNEWQNDQGEKRSELDIIGREVRTLGPAPEWDLRWDKKGQPILGELSQNHAVLSGNLTRDPEVRHTSSGQPVLGGGMAINEYQGRDKEDRTHFVDITAWGSTEKDTQPFAALTATKKGDGVFLIGSMRTGSYETRDGGRRFTNTLTVERAYPIVKDSSTPSASAPQARREAPQGPRDRLSLDDEFPPEEELPF